MRKDRSRIHQSGRWAAGSRRSSACAWHNKVLRKLRHTTGPIFHAAHASSRNTAENAFYNTQSVQTVLPDASDLWGRSGRRRNIVPTPLELTTQARVIKACGMANTSGLHLEQTLSRSKADTCPGSSEVGLRRDRTPVHNPFLGRLVEQPLLVWRLYLEPTQVVTLSPWFSARKHASLSLPYRLSSLANCTL